MKKQIEEKRNLTDISLSTKVQLSQEEIKIKREPSEAISYLAYLDRVDSER